MKQEERERFFTDQVTPGDFEAVTGYTRHSQKRMTAQYINECVDKRNGMEVADQDGTIWGWVYDCHKGVGKWFPEGTHDRRVKLMAKGFGTEELKPKYEPYRYMMRSPEPINTFGEDGAGGYDAKEWEAPESSPPGMVWCSDCGQHEPAEGETPTSDPVKPYIIAVEGIDGAGKNTYTQKLAAMLNAQVVSFPQYGLTSAAELIEAGLRNDEEYDPWHMAQLFAADRKESAHLLRGPGVIIVDRYVASNAAYLHAKTGYHGALDAMETLEYDTLGLPKPDLQILVDTPVEVAMGRAKSRAESEGGEPDTNEVNQGLQKWVRASYLQMVESQWVSPWIVIDGQAQK